MDNNPWKMPERCVAAHCSNVADPEKHISMHKIPFFGEKCPIKQKRRKRWINFVLERRKLLVPRKTSSLCSVILDEHVSWKSQIQNVARKVSKSVDIIYKSSFCLNKTSLCTLYYGLVYPYLHFCATLWRSTYQSNLKVFLEAKVTLSDCRNFFFS